MPNIRWRNYSKYCKTFANGKILISSKLITDLTLLENQSEEKQNNDSEVCYLMVLFCLLSQFHLLSLSEDSGSDAGFKRFFDQQITIFFCLIMYFTLIIFQVLFPYVSVLDLIPTVLFSRLPHISMSRIIHRERHRSICKLVWIKHRIISLEMHMHRKDVSKNTGSY